MQRTSVSFATLISRAMSGQASDVDQDILEKLHDKNLLRIQGYIGGHWRDAKDKATLDVSAISMYTCLTFTVFIHSAQNKIFSSKRGNFQG